MMSDFFPANSSSKLFKIHGELIFRKVMGKNDVWPIELRIKVLKQSTLKSIRFMDGVKG